MERKRYAELGDQNRGYGNTLYSLPAGGFVVTKFSRSGMGRREWSGAWFFHPSVQASNIFETVGLRVVSLCAVRKSISRGAATKHPKILGKTVNDAVRVPGRRGKPEDLLRAFLREKPEAKN